jgi:D-arginine dehydrogenase
VKHAWAGLRTAAPDDTPVIGAAPDAEGFVWLAGLSGYGVQSSPATGRIAAHAATGTPLTSADLVEIDLTEIGPGRYP